MSNTKVPVENLSAAEKKIAEAVLPRLRDADSVSVGALAKDLGYPLDIGFRKAFNAAKNQAAADGRNFVPVRGKGGTYRLATAKETIRSSQKRRMAAARKTVRGAAAVAALPDDGDEIRRVKERDMMITSRALVALLGDRKGETLLLDTFPKLPRGKDAG